MLKCARACTWFADPIAARAFLSASKVRSLAANPASSSTAAMGQVHHDRCAPHHIAHGIPVADRAAEHANFRSMKGPGQVVGRAGKDGNALTPSAQRGQGVPSDKAGTTQQGHIILRLDTRHSGPGQSLWAIHPAGHIAQQALTSRAPRHL